MPPEASNAALVFSPFAVMSIEPELAVTGPAIFVLPQQIVMLPELVEREAPALMLTLLLERTISPGAEVETGALTLMLVAPKGAVWNSKVPVPAGAISPTILIVNVVFPPIRRVGALNS